MSNSPIGVPLSTLIEHLPEIKTFAGDEVLVTVVVHDSRDVEPGALFVAVPGLNVDGHNYISDAIERGAVAVVGTHAFEGLTVPYVRVKHAPKALALLAAAFYGFPAHKLTVIGVTGTDGKTTTSNFIYQILKAAGLKVGMISTVNVVIGNQIADTGFHVTTPEAPSVQRYLAQMVEAGITHVVLEATSHGLAQHRVAACDFDIGVVTNITHEHLDYHGSYEAYQEAKGRLISSLGATTPKRRGNVRLAVLNHDDQAYEYLGTLSQDPVHQISYGFSPEADIRAKGINHLPNGLKFQILSEGLSFDVETRLLGSYNVYNILAAVGATVVGLGVAPDAARSGIAALEGIPGRMEPIDLGQQFRAIVDFAHTPNALKRALEAARPMTKGNVIAIFGSAGLRDREKRCLMAEVSAKFADLTVLTAEDPRTESLDDILVEMAQGAESQGGVEGQNFWRVPDRGESIRFALNMAQPGDLVLLCGKGHEQSMCFGEIEYPWDDRTALRASLAEHLGIEGPEMPWLPTSK